MTANVDSHFSRWHWALSQQASEKFETRLRETLAQHIDGKKLSRAVVEQSMIEIMKSITSDTLHELMSDTSREKPSETKYDQISMTILAILDDFGRDLVGLANRASGAAKSPIRVSELLGSYREMRSEIEADLVMNRRNYLDGKFASGSDISKPVVNRGGKPLAKHWDEVWAQIAFQLWNGDLQPETQADIKRAMFAWFNAREIEVGDTAITQRARQLWRLLEPHR